MSNNNMLTKKIIFNDSDELSEEKKPLKSVNGRRCLSKCYSKGTQYLHPVVLESIVDPSKDSCAIDPIPSKNAEDYQGYDMIFVDRCRLDDNKTYKEPDEFESILLSFNFNPSDFLAGIYDLHSFDQIIYWTLENEYLPTNTIKRVHNCAWRVYGSNVEELSSDVLKYYFNVAQTHWLRDYVKIIQNKYSFDLFSKKSPSEFIDTQDEIYNILSSTFFTYNLFATAIKKYIYEFQDKWDYIKSHYDRIKKYVLYQLMEHIENEINKKN